MIEEITPIKGSKAPVKLGTIVGWSFVIGIVLLEVARAISLILWISGLFGLLGIALYILPWNHTGRIVSYDGRGRLKVITETRIGPIIESVHIHRYNKKRAEYPASPMMDELIEKSAVGRIAEIRTALCAWDWDTSFNTRIASVSIDGKDILEFCSSDGAE